MSRSDCSSYVLYDVFQLHPWRPVRADVSIDQRNAMAKKGALHDEGKMFTLSKGLTRVSTLQHIRNNAYHEIRLNHFKQIDETIKEKQRLLR